MYEIIEKQKYKNRSYYLVKTEFGLCLITCDKWKMGRRPGISSALNKTEFFINQANAVHNFRFIYKNSVYKGSKTKLEIICQKGHTFLQTPNSHLQGSGCRICYDTESNGHDKSDTLLVFLAKAQEVHLGLYSYRNFVYTNSRTKSLITCKVHGDFLQKPSDHLQGQGCKKCSDLLLGWTRTDFCLRCKQNNSKGLFYILRCFNEDEEFYKLGITSSDIPRRYSSKHAMPYDYEIIQEIYDNPESIFNFEIAIKQYISHNDFKYTPLIKFGGSTTECFKVV